MDGLLAVASEQESEILVTAIVGMIGILPTIEAIKAGKDIALANKETLVTAGHIIMPLARTVSCVHPSGGTASTARSSSRCRAGTEKGAAQDPPDCIGRTRSAERREKSWRIYRWKMP